MLTQPPRTNQVKRHLWSKTTTTEDDKMVKWKSLEVQWNNDFNSSRDNTSAGTNWVAKRREYPTAGQSLQKAFSYLHLYVEHFNINCDLTIKCASGIFTQRTTPRRLDKTTSEETWLLWKKINYPNNSTIEEMRAGNVTGSVALFSFLVSPCPAMLHQAAKKLLHYFFIWSLFPGLLLYKTPVIIMSLI